jgi:hypothetical protein
VSSDNERNDNDRKVFGGLHEVRGACQYLQALVIDPAAKSTVNPALMTQIDGKISPALAGIRKSFETYPKQAEWAFDNLVHIELAWLHAKTLAPAADTPADRVAELLKLMAATLDDIAYNCSSLTLSPRVNDVLSNLRVGQALDFEFEFGNELPRDPENRKRLLDELAQEGGVLVGGVVDSAAGVIYKASPTRAGQRRSVMWLAVLLLAGFAIPLLLAGGWGLENWPIPGSRRNELLLAYLAVLAGSGIHLALHALKATHSQTRPDFRDTHDWILWVHVRFWSLTYGILWVMGGYVFLAFFVAKLDWQTALFAGYSIDSITDLFMERFEKLAGTAATKVRTIAGAPDAGNEK